MKILITGGAGFIGSHLADLFLKKGYQVVILDNLSSGKIENIPKGAVFIQGSVTDKEQVSKAILDVDYVFHLAAIVSVPLSFENPERCMEVNVKGTKNVLGAALEHGVKKVIYSSSAAVYGDNTNLPLTEEESYKPLSPYAQSKVEAEQLCHEYSQKGLKTCVLRFFNVYGTRQDPKSPYSGVISIFLEKAKNNEEITIYGNGKNTRDFIHVNDVVKANILAMKKGKGIYNVASGTEITIKELAEKIIKLSNSNSNIVHKEERKGDIKKSRADITKIKQLGYSPKINIEQGLKELIDN